MIYIWSKLWVMIYEHWIDINCIFMSTGWNMSFFKHTNNDTILATPRCQYKVGCWVKLRKIDHNPSISLVCFKIFVTQFRDQVDSSVSIVVWGLRLWLHLTVLGELGLVWGMWCEWYFTSVGEVYAMKSVLFQICCLNVSFLEELLFTKNAIICENGKGHVKLHGWCISYESPKHHCMQYRCHDRIP